jgi:hypothetical protein
MTVINAKVRKTRAITRSFIFATALILGACPAGIVMAQGGGGAVGGPTFKVLRPMAGSSGTEVKGHLVIDDPRTVFYLGQDPMAFQRTSAMTVYDVDNHEIAKSNPQKVSLHAGSFPLSTWEVPLASLPSGIYRVDVMLGDHIVWRKFFRLAGG